QVRAGRAAAREAVRGREREREAPELVDLHAEAQPAGSGGQPGREPAVPLLLHRGAAGGGAAPGPGAGERGIRGERPSPGGERGAGGDHLGVPGGTAEGGLRAAREGGEGEVAEEGRASRARCPGASAASAARG